MFDVVQFILGDFWHFMGTVVLIGLVGLIVSEWIELSTRSRR